MKKLVLILLCVVLLLSGCNKQKAEPYYPEVGEGVRIETAYKYYFADEKNIFCNWYNETDEKVNFHDTFELHELGKDGEWYLVGSTEDVSFNTKYKHGLDAQSETRTYYEISYYTDKLSEGTTYRISTYYFDAEENYYQIFAEFVCDSKLAEEEMLELSNGKSDSHLDPTTNVGTFEVPEESKKENE